MLCPLCITKWSLVFEVSISQHKYHVWWPGSTLLQLGIRHFIGKVCETLAFINPRQTLVVTADQQCTLTVQSKFDRRLYYGEDKFVIIIGWLLIELVVIRSVNTHMGWTVTITNAEVTSSGRTVILSASWMLPLDSYRTCQKSYLSGLIQRTRQQFSGERRNISSKLVSLSHIATSCQALARCTCFNPGLTMRPL